MNEPTTTTIRSHPEGVFSPSTEGVDQILLQLEKRRLNLDELLKFSSLRSWYFSRKEGHSRRSVIYRFNRFLKYRARNGLSSNPDEWVEQCMSGDNRNLVREAKILRDWAESDDFDGDKPITRIKYYRDLRGFYIHNMIPLPSVKVNPKGMDNTVPMNVTAKTFLAMAKKVVCFSGISTRDRSLIMTQLQSGMDASTLTDVFNHVGFPQIADHYGTEDWTMWDESKVPIRLSLIRPKSQYAYYTFIDHDALVCLKDWLNLRLSRYGGRIRVHEKMDQMRLATSDPIYVNEQGKPLNADYISVVFKRSGIQAGVNLVPTAGMPRFKGATRRYPFHSHEVRDTLVTVGRGLEVDVGVVNFFIGHPIDKYGYDKSPWDDVEHFRDRYSRLAKQLNVISGKEAILKEEYEKRLEKEIGEKDDRYAKLEKMVTSMRKEIAAIKKERQSDEK